MLSQLLLSGECLIRIFVASDCCIRIYNGEFKIMLSKCFFKVFVLKYLDIEVALWYALMRMYNYRFYISGLLQYHHTSLITLNH